MRKIADLDAVREAKEASHVLADPLLAEAFEAAVQMYLKEMLTLGAKDDLQRYRLSEAIKIVPMVRHHLRMIVENGKLSQASLDEMSGKRKRFF